MKLKTHTLFSDLLLQISFIFFLLLNCSSEYNTKSFSISSIFSYHQILSIYSIAFNKLNAHVRFGVHGSNLLGNLE
ncbi:MAG: hypothetical protein Q8S84_01690 [bacterium]|nr:hypothetical protein [bacterium]MDP3380275.1 hypothetical protein [bacterium]